MKAALQVLISSILPTLNFPEQAVEITIPEHSSHGTYTTNIGFLIGKQIGQNPKDTALKIAAELERLKTNSNNPEQQKVLAALAKIEVVGPGFINLTIAPSHLFAQLQTELDSNWQVEKKHIKVMVEFTDPNPFKPLHIGHLYSNAVGEAIARMYESQGFDVRRVCYQGDVGLHVGKALYGMTKLLEMELSKLFADCSTEEITTTLKQISSKPVPDQAIWLGKAYAHGSEMYETDLQAKPIIERYNIYSFLVAAQLSDNQDQKVINQYQRIIKEKYNSEATEDLGKIRQMFAVGREMSLAYFETQYEFLGTKFDHYFLESQVAGTGKQIVEKHLSDGIFEKSDNAIIYRGEKAGLHTRVFVNALGLPTYEAKELGLAPTKYATWGYDKSIIVTAKEINEYFQVLLSAMKEVVPDLAAKTVHIGHGVVKLPEGKMSSRKGNAPTIEGLFALVSDALQNIAVEKINKTAENNLDTLNKLAVAAVKYALLKVALPSDITFDLEKSISIEGDSGPYLLYSCVRAKNVLKKIGIASSDKYSLPENIEVKIDTVLEAEEHELLRHLSYAPLIWQEAALSHAPSRLCRYAVVVAQNFNALYAKHKIVAEESSAHNLQLTPRIILTIATAKILAKTLKLLGIETVEAM